MPRIRAVLLPLCLALAVALTLPSQATAAPAAEAPQSGATAAPAWDLVRWFEEHPLPEGVKLVNRGGHKQTRTSVLTAVPTRFRVPVAIESASVLELGLATQAAAFMVETPELAEPVRFQLSFEPSAGDATTLIDRRVDIRANVKDRRWFDERIDLGPLAGHSGHFVFSATTDGDPGKVKGTSVYWSTPRILRARGAAEPSVLFVTIDCLRADHVGAYGYEKATSPTIDGLAREGILFRHGFANAPMTLPSIPQIFTSRLFPTKDDTLLTDVIARAGIPNAAFVNNAWIPLWLGQGKHAQPPGTFDRIVSGKLDAKAISDLAVDWLSERGDERFFLYLHYLDAHTPYGPPESYIRQFADPGHRGKVGATFDDEEGADKGAYGDADRRQILALYDAAIRYIDDQLARVLARLEQMGRLDETVVILSADHGEEFWDHGRFFHGQSLYDELLHVPLIVRFPAAARAREIEHAVRLIDVAPSILDWMGLPVPAAFEGAPLAGALAPNGRSRDVVATATQAQFPTRYALRRAGLKLIETIDDGKRELYDVRTDPREKENQADERTADRDRLQSDLDRVREIQRRRGYQVRIVGPAAGAVRVRVQLESEPRSGSFLSADRTGPAGRSTVAVSPDAERLDFAARVDARGAGFRFDRLRHPRNIGGTDRLKLRLDVDDRRAPRASIALGESGRTPDELVIDIRAADVTSATAPACTAPQKGVRLCLWRFPGEQLAAMPEVKDPAVREKLRALGYLQ